MKQNNGKVWKTILAIGLTILVSFIAFVAINK